MKQLFFSIVIPVYNNAKNLENTLDSLQKLSYPSNFYEIIVVDNNSTDDIAVVKNKFKNVIWTNEIEQSSYASRNKGVSIANGDIVAFTDSDCFVTPNWLNEANACFVDHNVSAVAGKVEIYFKYKKPNIFEYIDSVRFLNQKKYVEQGYAATANLFVRRKTFDMIGCFLAGLISGGDYEMTKRLTRRNEKLVYCENAKVLHQARDSFEKIKNKTKRIAKGQKELKKQGLWQVETCVLRLLLPRKTILHNSYYNYFNVVEKIKIFLLFNYFHYLNLYYNL